MKMFSDSILPGAGSVPGGTESVPFRIPTGTPPTITVQPEGGNYDGVTPVTLEVTAIGDAPLTYQWYEGESGDTSTPIDGATAASYDAEPGTETDYWVRVSNGVNPPADSDTATVSLTAPVITGQPTGGEYDGVTPVTLTVTATGAGLTYQWSTGPSGTKDTEIPGATSASYDAEPGEETEYYCTVTNEGGEVDSDSATVTVLGVLASDDFVGSAGNLEGRNANNALGGSGTWPWARVEGVAAEAQLDGAGNLSVSPGNWTRVGLAGIISDQRQGMKATINVTAGGGEATLEIRGVGSSGLKQIKIKFTATAKPVIYLWDSGGSQLTVSEFDGTVPDAEDIEIYAYAEDLPTTGIRFVIGLGDEEITKDVLTTDLAGIDAHRLGTNTYAGVATDTPSNGATFRDVRFCEW